MKISLKLALAACGVAFAPAALAENYALIMGISDYVRNPLPGVPQDIDKAVKIARSMNVPQANIVVRRDAELTLDGLRKTLVNFGDKIRRGDRVFVYFSGHGSSRTVAGAPGQCVQSIVSREIGFMDKTEFQSLVKRISDKASKTFVFLDTCHSGGVVEGAKGTRAFGDEAPLAKFLTAKANGEVDACAIPSNVAAKGTRDFEIEEAKETPNFYMLAAAAPSEQAIDGGAAYGSYATTAFYQCLQPSSGASTNGDGVITLQEARLCAQRVINEKLQSGRARNPNFPYIAQTLSEGNGPGGNAPVAFEATTVPTLAVPQVGGPINSQALLETIRQGGDASFSVVVRPAKGVFQIGRDALELDVTSNKEGYLTVLTVGSSGKIYQVFPNSVDQRNHIAANITLRLPRPEWRLAARGPAGADKFLVLVSSTPDRFNGFGIPVGKFAQGEANTLAAKDIIERLITAPAGCQSGTRDFEAEANPCSSSYGAGLADVIEVN